MNEPIRQPPIIDGGPPAIPAPPKIPDPPVIPGPPKLPPASRLPPLMERFYRPVPQVGRQRSLLTPGELERFRTLLIFARSTVEGYFIGKHKSPHRGSSVEFTDYKEYVAGDEVNRIDWRAYGRSRRPPGWCRLNRHHLVEDRHGF